MKPNNSLLMLVAILMVLFSPIAFASDIRMYWHLYLFGIALISTLIALFITYRKKNIESTGIRIMIWGIYFWLVTFMQLILLSLLYVLA
jgi:hypothetical protein